MVLPSFLIILLVTALLRTVLKNPWVQATLRGLKPCVIGIVLATGLCMVVKNCLPAGSFDLHAAALTAALAAASLLSHKLRGKKLAPIPLIALSALLGLLFYGL